MTGRLERRKPIIKVLVLSAYLAVCILALDQPPRLQELRPAYSHILYVLIVLGAFFFGLPGGLATAVIASAVSMLYGMARGFADPQSSLDAMVQLGSFFLVGLVAGVLASRMARLKRELEKVNTTLETEVDRRATALTKANEDLRLANRAKSEFLTNASHEFKTPLNAIIGFADLIQDGLYGPINAGQRQAVEGILENAEDLLAQVVNLLEISRLESGTLDLRIDNVPVNELIEDVVSSNKFMLRKKRLDIIREPDDTLPIVRTDENRLRSVLSNLLSNAVKFTDEGHVRISTHNMPVTKQVEIVFQDTGVGIEPKDHDRIFSKFVQVDSSATRRHQGTGLGLTIVQKTVQRLGGKVTVESEKGKGARFRVLLPYEIPDGPIERSRGVADSRG